jgi:hypothetical protein
VGLLISHFFINISVDCITKAERALNYVESRVPPYIDVKYKLPASLRSRGV